MNYKLRKLFCAIYLAYYNNLLKYQYFAIIQQLILHPNIKQESSTKVATFQKRTAKDGSIHHRVQIRLKGRAESATFERLTDARRWAAETELAIRQGVYFKDREATRHTLAELIDKYVAEILPTKPKSIPAQSQQLAWWKRELGSRKLADVTPALIAESRTSLAKRGARGRALAPASINRYLAALSHVFTIAIRDWQWMESSPVKNLTKHKEPRGRTRFLSDEERQCLLDACAASTNIFLYPVVVVALSTGMRYGEILGLRWRNVDLEGGSVLLLDTKNGDVRLVPLKGRALQSVKEVREYASPEDTDLLFPSSKRPRRGAKRKPVDLRAPWLAAVAAAELENFRFHDLRHTAASYLAMNGASLIDISKILGHKTLQMVKRYAHLSEAHTAQVVASMNEKMFEKSSAPSPTASSPQ